ncbi:hypothetical protein H5410_023462 [Solanum commersonii]|uniref:Uncharacterized protein n=1 Tax=Solanum commersonii TaxID=4109 RepID=A0A9J5ZIB0_SOLCO|nr:hypothetical protein H5410_023462 [Solanum commersonii]
MVEDNTLMHMVDNLEREKWKNCIEEVEELIDFLVGNSPNAKEYNSTNSQNSILSQNELIVLCSTIILYMKKVTRSYCVLLKVQGYMRFFNGFMRGTKALVPSK